MEFIETVSKKFNCPISGLLKSFRGKYGGTYAHWKIALAYSEFLSPAIHSWFMDIVRQRFEEEQNPDSKTTHGG